MVFISGVKDRIEQTIFQRLMQNVVYFLWLDILLKNKTKQNKTKKQQQHTHEAEKHSTILPPHMFHTRNCEWLWEGGKPVRSDDQAGLTWTSDVSLCGHGTLEKKIPKQNKKTLCFRRKSTAWGHFNLSASPYQSVQSFSIIGLRGFDAMTFCSRVDQSKREWKKEEEEEEEERGQSDQKEVIITQYKMIKCHKTHVARERKLWIIQAESTEI